MANQEIIAGGLIAQAETDPIFTGAIKTIESNSDVEVNSAKYVKTVKDTLVASISGKASSSHTHTEADITGLSTDLAGKEPSITKNTAFNLDKASQAEAEAGTESTKLMTPERVKQAITALASSTPKLGDYKLLSNANSVTAVDWFIANDLGKWATANNAMKLIGANYPNALGIHTNFTTMNRGAISYHAGVWNFGYSASGSDGLFQSTSDFATITNREVGCQSNVVGSFYADNTNGQAVFTNFGISGSACGYAYTTNGTDWTQVYKTKSLNGLYTNLTNPCVSNGYYSFYDSLNAIRIYTTDHVNFTNVTGTSGLSSGTIHKMANGYLYILGSSNQIYLSTDNGRTFVVSTLPNNYPNAGYHCVDYDGTTFVYASNTLNTIYTATTIGTGNWTSRAVTGTYAVCWVANGTFFISYPDTPTTTNILTSTAPTTTWTQRTSAGSIGVNAVFYAHSKYFICSGSRTESSSNLSSWTLEISSGLSGNGGDSANIKNAWATGNKLVMSVGTTLNIYDTGSWSSITNAQQLTGISKIDTSGISGQIIRVKV